MKKCPYPKGRCHECCNDCENNGYAINTTMNEQSKKKELIFCHCPLGQKLKSMNEEYLKDLENDHAS